MDEGGNPDLYHRYEPYFQDDFEEHLERIENAKDIFE